ncbi:unnamed protein product [Cutaneotrichosporon oleaginosum]
MPRPSLPLDTALSPASSAPPLTPASTPTPTYSALAPKAPDLQSPKTSPRNAHFYPDLLFHGSSHLPALPLPLPAPDPALRNTPTAELGPFEYPVPVPVRADRPVAVADTRARAHAPPLSRSLPEDAPIRAAAAAGRHARSPSAGKAPPRLVPSTPRRGSTIAFAHAPLPAPIPPSLLRRQSATSPQAAHAALPGAEERRAPAPAPARPRPRPPPREKSLSQ